MSFISENLSRATALTSVALLSPLQSGIPRLPSRCIPSKLPVGILPVGSNRQVSEESGLYVASMERLYDIHQQ